MPITVSLNKKFPIPGAGIRDIRMSDMQAIKSALVAVDANLLSSITANFPGDVIASTGTSRNYPNKDISISKFNAWLSENAIVTINVNILKNGIVMQSLTIPFGESKIALVPITPITVLSTDYLTVDVLAGTGKDLVIRMDY